MKEFATLLPFLRRYRHMYIIGLLSIMCTDLLQLSIPKILGAFTDEVKDGVITSGQSGKFIALLLLAAAGIFMFRYLWRRFIFGAARAVEYELRNKLLAHLQTLSASWYDNRKTGDLMAHTTNDIGAIRFVLGLGAITIVDSLVMLSMAIFMMASTISWKLTLVGLFPLPLMALVTLSFGRMIYKRYRAAQESFSRLTEKVQENISGMRVVKAFVQEEAEINSFAAVNEQNYRRNMRVAQVQALFHPLVQFIAGLSLLLVLGYGGILVIRREISLGDYVAFFGYLGLLTWPIMAIGWMINIFQRGAASMARLNAIFAMKPEVQDEPERVDRSIDRITGEVAITGLTFHYPGYQTPALKNINVHVAPGQSLAVTGRTGSGKSTLASLLVRLYNPEPGQILIDGRDIRSIPLAVLRRDIGFVPQDHFLFSRTIKGNIAFGMDDYSEEEVVQAARDAGLLDNILDFPRGFETMVGERGVTLSGGQKQRLAIARALIKNPRILILDDCLSAVDTRTEEMILRRLKEIMKGRTTIFISHRISTIRHVDQIIVLDEGEITESGSHDELLAKNGLYREMYERQQLEEKISHEA